MTALKRYFFIFISVGVLLGLLFSAQSFLLAILSQIVIFSIASLGLNILTGFAGQVSIGNAAFMSIGAYASAMLVMKAHFPISLAVLTGGILAALFGLVIGFPALRMKGFYLAIATMAFGVVIEQIIAVIPALGGHDGIRNIPHVSSSPFIAFLINFSVYVFTVFVIQRIAQNPAGFRWRMVRDGELSAAAFGTETAKVKLQAFMMSAFLCGIAGSLYAHNIGYIRSADFGISRSLDLLAMIMIGGLGSYQGGLAGAILIIGLRFFFSRGFGPWLSVIIGSLLIVSTLFFPRGIAYGLYVNWHKRFQIPWLSLLRKIHRRRTRMEGKYVTVKGHSIFYRELGEGKPIIYIHGNTGSSRWWELVMDIPGYKTIALDMPNFGLSSSIDTADIDIYADYVVEFLKVLNIKNPILVGHSLGGAVCISLAVRNPEIPETIVLVDSAAPSGLKTPEEHYAVIELYKTSRDLMFKALQAVTPGLKNQAYFNKLVDDAMLMAPHAYAGNARALERFNYTGKTNIFNKPVLVIWCAKDIIVTRKMAEETYKAFPNSELKIFEDAGHSVIVENPDLFKKALTEFLKKTKIIKL